VIWSARRENGSKKAKIGAIWVMRLVILSPKTSIRMRIRDALLTAPDSLNSFTSLAAVEPGLFAYFQAAGFSGIVAVFCGVGP
jgi:hypothetical protein